MKSSAASRLAEIRQEWTQAGRDGRSADTPALLTETVDRVLIDLSAGLDQDRLALVAIGGYGRGELCLHSDIDLMLLGQVDQQAIRSVLYPLWDLHLKVGHSVRKVREALAAATESLETLCSLLTSRLVWGSRDLFAELEEGLAVLLRRQRVPLASLLAEEERLLRLQEPFFLQEMNVKLSRGGLRALHRLDWMSHRQRLLNEEIDGDPAPDERRLLLSVRNALHAVSGRAHDHLSFDLRERVGQWLGQPPLEVCSQLYEAARKVDDLAWDRWGDPPPVGSDPVASAGRRLVAAVRGRWTRPNGKAATPLVSVLRSLDGAQVRRLSTSELDTAAATPVDTWSELDRTALVEMLGHGARGWWPFRQLERHGWVGEAIPEWTAVVALPQVAPFHLHPVDSHLWRTVDEAVETTAGANPWCADLAEDLGSIDELLLAAWLHDIGKGSPGDHSQQGAHLSQVVLSRLGFATGTVNLVSKVVAHHLLLARTATREDLDDPEVIGRVARRVGDEQSLAVLALLTVADSLATGPGIWTEWTEALVRSLFVRVKARLSGHSQELTERIDDPILAQHIAGMPPGYLPRFGKEMAQRHQWLAMPAPERDEIRMDIFGSSTLPSVVVVALDRPGLLATVAGVFSLHNLNVLEARVATRTDGIAIDTFRLEDALGSGAVGNPRWTGVRSDLEAALRGELDLEARLQSKATAYRSRQAGSPPSVEVRAGDGITVTVRGPDRVGLLHDVARSISLLGLDIHLAKVSTRGDEVLDVFQLKAGQTKLEEIRATVSASVGVRPSAE